MSRYNVTVESVDYHRNGICGEGFAVAIFRDNDDGRRMVATVAQKYVPDPRDGDSGYFGEHVFDAVTCRVLDIDLLAAGDIAFGSNSWRGDNYGDALIPEITRMLDERHEALIASLRQEADNA
jgi:hypothetical protein